MASWHKAKVVKRIDWNNHLFTLKIQCDEFPSFKAGQFVKVGLQQDNGQVLSRPYSIVSAPHEHTLDVLAVPVEAGKLSPNLHKLSVGDDVMLMSPATGFLILDEIPKSEQLFMLATGTGVGPFISILAGNEVWEKFQKIVLVYGVRKAEDLAYLEFIERLESERPQQFNFVPVVSREEISFGLLGRIPNLIETKAIQDFCSVDIQAHNTQVMMCGNPDMIEDGFAVLKKLGLEKHLRRSPGQISTERYW